MTYDEADGDLDELPPRPRQVIPAADRELLELAARALGAVRVEDVEGENWLNLHFADGSTVFNWNPLVHRDDVFNLACDCFIELQYGGDFVVADGPQGEATELFDRQDMETRRSASARAAVRAAAEIGKAMAC